MIAWECAFMLVKGSWISQRSESEHALHIAFSVQIVQRIVELWNIG